MTFYVVGLYGTGFSALRWEQTQKHKTGLCFNQSALPRQVIQGFHEVSQLDRAGQVSIMPFIFPLTSLRCIM